MSVTDAEAQARLFEMRHHERKALFAEYKCSISFDTVEQMVAFVAEGDIHLGVGNDTRKPVSDMFHGNCVVMESPPNFIFKTTQYLTYLICPSGVPGLIRLGMEFSDSLEAAEGWLSSPAFAVGKTLIIAETDTALHEHDPQWVLKLVNGNVDDRLYLKNQRFIRGFLAWDRARSDSALFQVN